MEKNRLVHLNKNTLMDAMIQIPKPCAANWEAMTPEGKGRHCGQCCKTVVDFTQWDSPDILAYLRQHQGVCGHFRSEQLNVPIPAPEVFVSRVNDSFLSFAQKIAAVLLFVFCIMGASCSSPSSSTTSQTSQLPGLSAVQQVNGTQLTGDTVAPPVKPDEPETQRLMGEPAIMPDTNIAMPDIAMPDPGPTTGGAPVIVEPLMPVTPDTAAIKGN